MKDVYHFIRSDSVARSCRRTHHNKKLHLGS